jgi:uncharacterized protein involved in response to NO
MTRGHGGRAKVAMKMTPAASLHALLGAKIRNQPIRHNFLKGSATSIMCAAQFTPINGVFVLKFYGWLDSSQSKAQCDQLG